MASFNKVILIGNMTADPELRQTIDQLEVYPKAPLIEEMTIKTKFVVGGNWMGSNGRHFNGVIRSLAVWSDVRTAEEIAADINKAKPSKSDAALLAAYDFTISNTSPLKDISSKANTIKKEVLWQDVGKVADVGEFAYSFAIIGDTQELSEMYFNDHYLGDKGKDAEGNKNGNKPYDDVYVDEDTDPLDNRAEYLAMIYSWLIENKEKHKIAYAMGLGDVTQKSYTAEWDYARSQIYRLNGIIPFSIARGNHDKVEDQLWYYVDKQKYFDPALDPDALFHKTFNNETYLSQVDGTFKDWDVANTYDAFVAGNTKYLLICLDYGASDEVLEWAGKLIEAHADHRVIITTHAYLFRDGTTLDNNDAYPASKSQGGVNDGDDMWEKLIRKYENIILVLSGHDPCDHIVYTQAVGDNGNVVHQMLINPQ